MRPSSLLQFGGLPASQLWKEVAHGSYDVVTQGARDATRGGLFLALFSHHSFSHNNHQDNSHIQQVHRLSSPYHQIQPQWPLFVCCSVMRELHRHSSADRVPPQTTFRQSSPPQSRSALPSTTPSPSPSSAPSLVRPTARRKPPTARRSSSSPRRLPRPALRGVPPSLALPSSHTVSVP